MRTLSGVLVMLALFFIVCWAEAVEAGYNGLLPISLAVASAAASVVCWAAYCRRHQR